MLLPRYNTIALKSWQVNLLLIFIDVVIEYLLVFLKFQVWIVINTTARWRWDSFLHIIITILGAWIKIINLILLRLNFVIFKIMRKWIIWIINYFLKLIITIFWAFWRFTDEAIIFFCVILSKDFIFDLSSIIKYSIHELIILIKWVYICWFVLFRLWNNWTTQWI